MPKKGDPIPAGFHTVTPHVNVTGAAAYADFLKKAFDAVEIRRSPGPGGKLMHVEMQIGDSRFMFADDFTQEFGMPAFAKGPMPYVFHMYVKDADAVFAKAVAAGATVKMPLSDQFWGDRYGHVQDPFGITWAIATHQYDYTPEELAANQAKAFSKGHP